MINLKERMLPTRRESNPQPLNNQSDAHQVEPLRPAFRRSSIVCGRFIRCLRDCGLSWAYLYLNLIRLIKLLLHKKQCRTLLTAVH